MAGWREMTRDDGKPYDENLGYNHRFERDSEIVETLKECYGMIWYLATLLEWTRPNAQGTPRRGILELIEEARRNAKIGIARGMSEN